MKVYIVHPSHDYGADSVWSTQEKAQARLDDRAQRRFEQALQWHNEDVANGVDPELWCIPDLENIKGGWYIHEREVDFLSDHEKEYA